MDSFLDSGHNKTFDLTNKNEFKIVYSKLSNNTVIEQTYPASLVRDNSHLKIWVGSMVQELGFVCSINTTPTSASLEYAFYNSLITNLDDIAMYIYIR